MNANLAIMCCILCVAELYLPTSVRPVVSAIYFYFIMFSVLHTLCCVEKAAYIAGTVSDKEHGLPIGTTFSMLFSESGLVKALADKKAQTKND